MNISHQAYLTTPARSLWAASSVWARELVRRVVAPSRDSLPASATLTLNRGATTWLTEPLGCKVSCDSGTLWLCFDGEPLDIVLEPGESHLCVKRSALSIHALSAGVVRLA